MPRYGLRRHYRVAPWTDLVEVHWTPGAEAYVTPVADDVVGIGLLFGRPRRDAPAEAATGGNGTRDDAGGDFAARLAAFPALRDRLGAAPPASEESAARDRWRQDVRRRVSGRVLLVGDASGYLDSAHRRGHRRRPRPGRGPRRGFYCLSPLGRPGDYEPRMLWRCASGPAWRFTAGLLWSRNQSFLGPRIVPAAQRLPWLFAALVNHAAQA